MSGNEPFEDGSSGDRQETTNSLHAAITSSGRADKVRHVIRTSTPWDNHICLPLRADDSFLPELERYRKAGVRMVSANIGFGEMSWAQHIEIGAFFSAWIASHSDRYLQVRTVDDIDLCAATGRLGIAFDVEGMAPVVGHPTRVRELYDLGVRWMLIAYNQPNAAGGGCLNADDGLTDAGRAVIDEMEQVGMVLCLSHTGHRTASEALDYARKPAIFSHSHPVRLVDHPRNIPDDLIRKCASRGGVIGLSGIQSFLGADQALLKSFLKQTAHLLDLVGPSHVGIALDFIFDSHELDHLIAQNPQLFAPGTRGGPRPALGPDDFGAIVEGLIGLGLTDDEVRSVIGGNWRRIADEVWR